MPEPFPYLRCSARRETMALPHSSLTGEGARRRSIPPEQWHAWLQCPHCGRVFQGSASAFQFWKVQTSATLSIVGIPHDYAMQIECSEPNCDSRLAVFAPSLKFATHATLAEMWKGAFDPPTKKWIPPVPPIPTCANGHPLSGSRVVTGCGAGESAA